MFYQFCENCKILSFTYHLKEAEMKITYVCPFLRASQKSGIKFKSLFGKVEMKITYVCPFLKCYYDQILDIHFFTFSHTIGVSKIFCQISIYYEQQNSCFLYLYFREFTAAINFPCSRSGLRIGENYIIFSKIPHGLKL